MFRIYLTNLGKYNEGELVGEWLELPTSQEEINACLKRIGINDEPDENGTYYEEYFITDYETDINIEIGEYENLGELNELAAAVEGNEDIAEVLIYFGYSTAEQIRDNLDNVIYVCTPEGFESDQFAVGYYYAEETGMLSGVPDEIKNYFDYEAYGRDIMINGSFYTAKNGNIYELVA